MSQEQGVGERPDAARDGRDRGCNLARRREVDVTDEMAIDHVDAHVDDHGTGLEHVAGHESGMPGRNDDDVRDPGVGREVAGPRVADGDRGAGLGEHEGNGHPDNRGTADHDGLRPDDRGTRSFEDFERSVRGRRNEALEPEPEQPRVEWMDAIDVLGRVDRVDHGPDADARRQWHLHDDPRHLVIGAQRPDRRRKLPSLACGIVPRDVDEPAVDADRRAGLEDAVEVHHGRCRPAADHDREARRVTDLGREGSDINGNTGPDLVGDRASLQETRPGLNGHAGISQRCPSGCRWPPGRGVRRRRQLHAWSRQGS